MPDTAAEQAEVVPFAVRDCALITLATAIKAQNLREFRDGLERMPAGSVYHHFWGRLLRPQFDEPEYISDFASWAYHGLHEKSLAEQLSVISPVDFDDPESLRLELIEVVEQRLDQSELVPWARADQQFHFLDSQIVVFDTGLRIERPSEMGACLATLSTGSIYYHFIDARNRTEQRCDDFSAWLAGFGEDVQPLRQALMAVDPYFSSLKEIGQIVTGIFRQFFPEGT